MSACATPCLFLTAWGFWFLVILAYIVHEQDIDAPTIHGLEFGGKEDSPKNPKEAATTVLYASGLMALSFVVSAARWYKDRQLRRRQAMGLTSELYRPMGHPRSSFDPNASTSKVNMSLRDTNDDLSAREGFGAPLLKSDYGSMDAMTSRRSGAAPS